jgi:hypothetical protein
VGAVDTKAVGEGNAEAMTEASWTDRRKGFAARKVGSGMRAAELESSEAGLMTLARG